MELRHEWKHLITAADRLAIRQRLLVIADPDSHGEQGRYFVRSLYFDNLQDKALREKLDGVSRREKFRIRCYDLDDSLIHLECKRKIGGLGHKDSCRLTPEEVHQIRQGQLDWMIQDDRALVRELYPVMRLLLARLGSYKGESGTIENPPSFMFVDWGTLDGNSMHHPPMALGQAALNALGLELLAVGRVPHPNPPDGQ